MKFYRLASLAACAALLFGAAACEKIEHEPLAAVEFANSSDSKIDLPALSTDPYLIDIKSNFDIDGLVIEAVKGGDWCSAEFVGSDQIKVIPNDKREDLLSDKSAEFVIKSAPATKSVKIIYDATEVHFLVKRTAGVEKDKAVIVLANENDAKVELPALSVKPYVIGFTANYEQKNLAIETVKGEDWCQAAFDGEGKIVITPNDKRQDLLQVKSAEFVVKYVQTKADNVLYIPAEVKIKVTRAAATEEDQPVIVVENTYSINAGSVEPLLIDFKANYPMANLMLEQKDGTDWCSAAFSGNQIRVTPTATGVDADKTATFSVSYVEMTKAAGIIYVPKTASFIVKRNKLQYKDVVVISVMAMSTTIDVEPNSTEIQAYSFSYSYGFNNDNVVVKVKSGNADWCKVELRDKVLSIVPQNVNMDKDMETTFQVTSEASSQYGDVIYNPLPYEFTVRRAKYIASAEPTMTLTAEGLDGNDIWYGLPLNGRSSVNVLVNTNQEKWSVSAPAGLEISQLEGVDGESFIITVTPDFSGYGEVLVTAGSLEYHVSVYR